MQVKLDKLLVLGASFYVKDLVKFKGSYNTEFLLSIHWASSQSLNDKRIVQIKLYYKYDIHVYKYNYRAYTNNHLA